MKQQTQVPPIQVRLPDGLRDDIRKSAKESFRTLQAEILYRLNLLERLKQDGKIQNFN